MSEKNTVKAGDKLTPPEDKKTDQQNAESPKAMTAEELAAWEARLRAEESALKDREYAIDAASKKSGVADVGPGLIDSDIDTTNAPEEVKRGASPKAASADRRAYHKWVKETYGVVPKKVFHVEIKKGPEVIKAFDSIHATDEADAVRIAFNHANLTGETHAYTGRATGMGNVAA